MTSTTQPTATTTEASEAMVEAVLNAEEASLRRYRDEDCQGDDTVKRHAWIVADARLSEVGVIRRKLLEAALSTAPSGDGVPGMVLAADYQTLFNAISAATKIEAGAIGVSVKAFRAALSQRGTQ